MSGLLTQTPERLIDGQAQPDALDPLRMAIDQGRRDFALELLALGGMTPKQLNQLMESKDEY